jgi:hypothetical protein
MKLAITVARSSEAQPPFPQGSEAEGGAKVLVISHAAITSEGHVIIGTPRTGEITLKLHVAVAPNALVASNVTTFVPAGNTDPLGNPAICVTVTGAFPVPEAPV